MTRQQWISAAVCVAGWITAAVSRGEPAEKWGMEVAAMATLVCVLQFNSWLEKL